MGIRAINAHVAGVGTPIKVYTPSASLPPLIGPIQIQADPTNTLNIYLGTKGMVKGTTNALRQNVIAVLAPGQIWPTTDMIVDPDYLWIDADTAGNGVNIGAAG